MPALRRSFALLVGALVLAVFLGALGAADDAAAAKALADAKQAFDQKNYPVAVQRYRDFLTKFADHKDAAAARLGLAQTLLELPEADAAGAIEQLQMLAAKKEAAEHPAALYHLGVAHRALAVKDRVKAATVPSGDAAPLLAQAKQRFAEAAKQFAAAALAFRERAKNVDPAAPLAPDLEAAVRAQCHQVECLIDAEQPKEAQAVVAGLVKDPRVLKSKFARLTHYYDGWTRFLLKDYHGAGRALAPIASFGDAGFGTHARYLLARVHHLEDERAEATVHYEGLLNDHEAHRKNAVEALKRPDLLKGDLRQKAYLTHLVRGPAPEHIACANFYLGVIHAEAGKFGDAVPRFAAFTKLSPKSPLQTECQLRTGICHVQLKNFAEAGKVLQPLLAQQPQLADQIHYWIGRAYVGAAGSVDANAAKQLYARGAESFRVAADKAKEREGTDAAAKKLRGIILLELGDTYQQAGAYKEAAAAYEGILNDKVLPGRDAEVLQRLAESLNLAGDFAGSDKVCARFQQEYPKSPFLPAVLFRHGENAAFQLAAVQANPQFPNRDQEIQRLTAETAKRYQDLINRFPEFEYSALARFGMGLSHYRKGEFAKARDIFAGIASADRKDDLAIVGYLQADCILRLAPIKVDDAIAAGKLTADMNQAIEQLDGFVGAAPKGPYAADALLRIGYCKQRQAALVEKADERAKILTEARVAYKRIYAEFPQSPAVPYAVFEEAKCFVSLGNAQRATVNLTRFTNELKNSPIAPLALVNFATLMRAQNRAADGANLLAQARQQYEAGLKTDKDRAAWVPLLQLHQGICVREAGKPAEARAIFDGLLKDYPKAPETAEAALRRGQCLKEEILPEIVKLRAATQGKSPDGSAPFQQLAAALKTLGDAGQYLEAQAKALEKNESAADVRARMLYEAAWAQRLNAETEIEQARTKLALEQKKDIPLSAVPPQPAEKSTRTLYEALIAGQGEHPLAVDARLELGELLAERSDPSTAIRLYSEALDLEPAVDLVDKIRIRLGLALAAKGDAKVGQAQLETVSKNPKSPLAGVAQQQVQALAANKPLPLPAFGAFRADRASLADPTAASLALATAPIAAERTRPAPYLRLTLPDPYEYHYVLNLPPAAGDDLVPLPGPWPLGG